MDDDDDGSVDEAQACWLWLLTAHPDTGDLYDDPPDWLADLALRHGVAAPGPPPRGWHITAQGRKAISRRLASSGS